MGLVVMALVGTWACRTSGPDSAELKLVPNTYARHFQIWERGGTRQLLVFGPGGATDTVGVYVIGTPEGEKAIILPPLERIAVVSSTHLAYIDVLDRTDRVVGVSGASRVRNARVLERIEHGTMVEIGSAEGIDRERLITLHAQALLDYPFGRSTRQASVDGMARIEVTEYLEEHPLGRAEWVRFFGVLLGRERTADSLFKAIEDRYEQAARRAAASGPRPQVFFGSSWQGEWHVPPGNSYMATLIHDAGGGYAFADREAQGNLAMDLESVMSEGGKADRFGIVVAHGGPVTPELIAGGDPRIASLPSVSAGGFALDSERSDIFGQALLEPDVLLEELACCFHPATCAVNARKYVFEIAQ